MSKTIDIGFKKLRDDADFVIEAVANGDNFIVSRKSQKLFRIVPLDYLQDDSKDMTIDFSDRPRGGIDANDLINQIESFIKKTK